MNWLRALTLFVTGFVACAEFGSWAFVHPVVRRLPAEHHLAVEQGLLRTFGRVMPVGMTAAPVLALAWAAAGGGAAGGGAAGGGAAGGGPAVALAWTCVATTTAALVSTLAVNVRINRATGRWDPASPPPGWKATRDRWERFQGVRSTLLLVGFAAACGVVGLG